MTSFESERKVFKELIINQSSKTDNDKINLNEKNTVLVKSSLTKVKKGAVLFENKKVKVKLNDKRCHYNQVTREVASMVAEVVVLDKGSGEAIPADIVLNMEKTILTVNTFGEKKESLLTEIFLGPYLKHLDNDEGGRSRPRMDQPEESWRSGGSTFSNTGDNSSWRSRNSDNGDNRSTSWRRGDNSRPKSMLEENREVEHRMAKLALAEIGKQKVRDVVGEKKKTVESEEKIRLRERRKREEEKKLKKEKEEEEKSREEEVRIKEEQKKKAEEEENRRQLAKRKEKIEEFWVELLPKNLEEGHLLMTEKESEEGWTRQEIFLLNKILCYNWIFFFSLNFL